MELLAPPVIMYADQQVSTLTPGGQLLTWTITISDAMPFCVLSSRDAEVSLMILQVFLTLQIPISELALASLAHGPSGDIMLSIALGTIDDFYTFLVIFFIVDPMLPYEAILTWGESQSMMALVSPDRLLALAPAQRSITSVFY
jgi:hypothetical protein